MRRMMRSWTIRFLLFVDALLLLLIVVGNLTAHPDATETLGTFLIAPLAFSLLITLLASAAVWAIEARRASTASPEREARR